MLETGPSHENLASTARWTAGARALENRRPDRLFADPWAEELAGREGMQWAEQRGEDRLIPILLRTRFFDDFLQNTLKQEPIRQVILLGAGLDTRAFRLDWPEYTRVFELDQPAVLDHKEKVLSAAGASCSCKRNLIRIDLTGPWEAALLSSAFDPTQPSFWLLEGFLFYLPDPAVTRILDLTSGLAASGSWCGFDVVNSHTLSSPWTKPWVDMQAQMGAPWLGTMDDPQAILAQRGWQTYLSQAGAPDAHHGRWTLPVIPVEAPDFPHNWFVTAQKI
jgi:methyltransferase (TIGR00027 family)